MANEGFIYGMRAIIEAIDSGKDVDKVFLKKGMTGDLQKELIMLLRRHHIPYKHVPIEKLNRITRKNHQGAIAFFSPITFSNIEHILPALFENGKVPLILVLDNITDVRNFGAICRSAECAGVHAIIVPQQGAAAINADAMKTSAGALNYIPVCRPGNLPWAVDFLKNSGLQIVAATEKTDSVHFEADFTGPIAIIVGAEDVGISEELLNLADIKAKIPISGQISSLNVSAASAVIIYEALRQRMLMED